MLLSDVYPRLGDRAGFDIVQIGEDCIVERAGIPKAVGDFRTAMGGGILSFTRRNLIPDDDTPWLRHIPVHPGGLRGAYGVPSPEGLRQAKQLVAGARLLVVHGLYRYHAQWVKSVAAELQLPYWVALHGALDPYVFTYRSAQKKLWMQLVGKPLIQGAQRVVVATEREQLKAAPYLAGAEVSTVYLPVDTDMPERSGELRERTRAQLGVAAEDRVLLFLGRLHSMKRVLETIEVVARANSQRVHLLIVGPSSDELTIEQCIEHAAAYHAQHRVHVVGPAFGEEKHQWIAAADGFVSLSHRENFNYAAAEAMAAGLPVILSPGNDLAREVESVEPGWLLRSLDAAEAVAAVDAFGRANLEELRAMGQRGRAWVRQEATPTIFAQRLQALYEQVPNR